MTISPQMRAVALAAVLVAVALGLGLMAFSHVSTGSTTAPKTIRPLHPVKHPGAAPAKVKASTAKKIAVARHPVAKPTVTRTLVAPKTAIAPTTVVAPKAAVVPKTTVAPKPVAPRIAAPNGLPVAVAAALEHHPVVVVALYQAKSRVQTTARQRREATHGLSAAAAVGIDQLSLGEAAAGAFDAHAGFVGVNVLSQREAAPLASLLGALADPAVLVYTQPGTLATKLTGFVDRDTVAQAASAADTTVPADAWAARASAACHTAFSGIHSFDSSPAGTGALTWRTDFDGAVVGSGKVPGFLTRLRAIPGPTPAERELTRLYSAQVVSINAGLATMAGTKSIPAVRAWTHRAAPLNARVAVLEEQAGIAGCLPIVR